MLFAALLLAVSALGQNRIHFGIDATADCFGAPGISEADLNSTFSADISAA